MLRNPAEHQAVDQPLGWRWFGKLCTGCAMLCALGAGPALAQRPSSMPPPLAFKDPEKLISRDNLPAEIMDLPGVAADLEVIHRRSQLVVTKTNIVRSAIADASIIDVVQFTPNEIAILGQAM